MSQATHIRTARDTIINSTGLLQLDFLRMTSEVIQQRMKADNNEIRAMKQELSLIEDARLHIRNRSNGHAFFTSFERRTNKETSIAGDNERIYQLARRSYLERRIAATESSTRKLKKLLETAEEALDGIRMKKQLKRYKDAKLDLSRIIFTREQNEWIDEPFSPNPYYPENLKYPTKGNVMTRSKSESKIGSLFEEMGIPYRYDDFVAIKSEANDGQPFRGNYFADFKIPNLTGGITVHEHLGAFHLDQYPDNSLKRLNDYHNFTVVELEGRPVIHSEFTWSFECDLRSDSMTRQLIRKMLLPEIN